MNVVRVLVAVGSCACLVLPQPTQITHLPQNTQGNYTQHVAAEEETKVKPDEITLERRVTKDTRMHVYKSESVEGIKNMRRDSRTHKRSEYFLEDFEAKVLEMNKRHPSRGELRTLPALVKLREEEASQINATSTPHSKDCVFQCPDAVSLAPCTCDPCAHSINCSSVESFEQLYHIFHSTYFPEQRFMQFLMVAPFRTGNKSASRSDTFLANTFGDVSFTAMRVELVTELVRVEAGAFAGSEETLTEITFKWNSALTDFPFAEIEKMGVLDRLEVRGSRITAAPVLPFHPKLTKLYLSDNNFMTNIPQQAFAQLPNLLFLDLGFSSLQILQEHSLYFSAQNLLVFLDHNFIDTIHENTFSGFPPSGLDVSNNNLATLDQIVFQPILDHIIAQQYDSYIDASYNPLQCGSLGWLMENSIYLNYLLLSDPPCM